MPRRQPVPRFALVLLGLLAGSGAFGAIAIGSDPGEGSVSLEQRQTGWSGKSFAVGASMSRQVCSVPSDELCDRFQLTVDVDAAHWEANRGGAEVVIAWEDEADDFDLHVLDSEGNLVGSSARGGTTSERVLIEDASGTYDVVVNPYQVTDSGYAGGVLLESRARVDETDGDIPTEPVSDVACEDGKAGPFPCKDVDLAGFLPIPELNDGVATDTLGDPVHLNDIWGWTDPQTRREYALVGKTNGTAFVDITDASAPRYLGSLRSHQPVETLFKTWRDVKVHDGHAFIVSEEPAHGMQVFDLTRLRGVTEPQEWTEDAHYALFGNAHNIAINEDSGFAYAIGTSTCQGGPHIVDVREPKAPSFAGCVFEDGYTHDTQCVNYAGPDERFAGREICFNSNEDTLTIVDVTDKLAPVQLSRTEYEGAAYTHQGWLSRDGAHFLVNDELDEQESGQPTTTRIFDVSKLDRPALKGAYRAGVASIDHNLYTKGDLVYEANYRSGLRVLDGARVADGELREVGFFDVYPPDDEAEFNGAWSNFPYYASNTVVVSGIEQGLFVLKPRAGAEEPGGAPVPPAPPAPVTAPETAAPAVTATNAFVRTATRPVIARVPLRASRRGAVRLRIRCAANAGSRCLGRVTLRAGGRSAGSRRFAIPGARTSAVTVRLNRAAKRRLARRGALRTRVVVSSRGSDGVTRRASRTVRLRAPR
jgi:choice-of-anchor B domain-containing protein